MVITASQTTLELAPPLSGKAFARLDTALAATTASRIAHLQEKRYFGMGFVQAAIVQVESTVYKIRFIDLAVLVD